MIKQPNPLIDLTSTESLIIQEHPTEIHSESESSDLNFDFDSPSAQTSTSQLKETRTDNPPIPTPSFIQISSSTLTSNSSISSPQQSDTNFSRFPSTTSIPPRPSSFFSATKIKFKCSDTTPSSSFPPSSLPLASSSSSSSSSSIPLLPSSNKLSIPIHASSRSTEKPSLPPSILYSIETPLNPPNFRPTQPISEPKISTSPPSKPYSSSFSFSPYTSPSHLSMSSNPNAYFLSNLKASNVSNQVNGSMKRPSSAYTPSVNIRQLFHSPIVKTPSSSSSSSSTTTTSTPSSASNLQVISTPSYLSSTSTFSAISANSSLSLQALPNTTTASTNVSPSLYKTPPSKQTIVDISDSDEPMSLHESASSSSSSIFSFSSSSTSTSSSPSSSSSSPSKYPFELYPSHFWLGTKQKKVLKIQFNRVDRIYAITIHISKETGFLNEPRFFEWTLPVQLEDPNHTSHGKPLSIHIHEKYKFIAIRCAEFTDIPYSNLAVSSNHFDPWSPNQENQYIRFLTKLLPFPIRDFCPSLVAHSNISEQDYEANHKNIVHKFVCELRSPPRDRLNQMKRRLSMSPETNPISLSQTTSPSLNPSLVYSTFPSSSSTSTSSSSSETPSHFNSPIPEAQFYGSSSSTPSTFNRRFTRSMSSTPSSSSHSNFRSRLQEAMLRPSPMATYASTSKTSRTSSSLSSAAPASPKLDKAKLLYDQFVKKYSGLDPLQPIFEYPPTFSSTSSPSSITPSPSLSPVSIRLSDLQGLFAGQCLNDVLIEFYLKYIILNHCPSHFRSQLHLFSSFFYSTLKSSQKGYMHVQSWTKNVNVFGKQLWIIPMYEQYHWYLCLVLRPDVMFQQGRYFSSLQTQNEEEETEKEAKEEDEEEEESENESETKTEQEGKPTFKKQRKDETKDLNLFNSENQNDRRRKKKPSESMIPKITVHASRHSQRTQFSLNRSVNPSSVSLTETVIVSEGEEEEQKREEDIEDEFITSEKRSMESMTIESLQQENNEAKEDPDVVQLHAYIDSELEQLAAHPLETRSESFRQTPFQSIQDLPSSSTSPSLTPSPSFSKASSTSPMDLDDLPELTLPSLMNAPTPSTGLSSNPPMTKVKRTRDSFITTFDAMQCELSTFTDQPTIVMLDSLSMSRSASIRQVSEYICLEAETKHLCEVFPETWEKYTLRRALPVQPNLFDCGIYMLHFLEQLLKDWEVSRCLLSDRKAKWESGFWEKETLLHKRSDIMQIALSLADDYLTQHAPGPGPSSTS